MEQGGGERGGGVLRVAPAIGRRAPRSASEAKCIPDLREGSVARLLGFVGLYVGLRMCNRSQSLDHLCPTAAFPRSFHETHNVPHLITISECHIYLYTHARRLRPDTTAGPRPSLGRSAVSSAHIALRCVPAAAASATRTHVAIRRQPALQANHRQPGPCGPRSA